MLKPAAPPPAGAVRRPQALLLAALLLVSGVLLLLLLPGSRNGGEIAPAEGGRLREAVQGPAARMNPLDGGATPAERDLAALVFAGLTRPGPDGAPQPALAGSWDVSEDACVFIFRLRRGLTWHDGHPVSADDVLFSVDALIALGERADTRLADVWRSAALARVNGETVRVELPQPFAPLPSFASFGLLPAHLLADVPAEGLAEHEFFGRPVGAGPFRLLSLGADGAVLRRFPGYALGPPLLEAVELRFVEASSTAGRALADGGAHAAVLGHVADVRLARAGEGGNAPQARTVARTAYTVILLNHRVELFADPRVRRALSLAVDRVALAAQVGGLPADTPFTPGWWAADGGPWPAPDRDAALRLLGEAGWSRGPDGVARRERRELAFTLLVPTEGGREPLARLVAAAWQGMGARVTVAPADANLLLRDFLVPRAFQAAMVGWDPGPDPDPFTAWHSALRGRVEGNLSDTADAELDALATAARAARSQEQRRDLYLRFAARFRDVTPGIVLFAEGLIYVTRPPLAGVDLRAAAEPADRFAGVHRWHLRTRRRQ